MTSATFVTADQLIHALRLAGASVQRADDELTVIKGDIVKIIVIPPSERIGRREVLKVCNQFGADPHHAFHAPVAVSAPTPTGTVRPD